MYTPALHRVEDLATLISFMQKHSFVSIISNLETGLVASHIPVIVEAVDEQVIISGHLAKANPQAKSLTDSEHLIIFTGPHAYISPSYYEKHASVPTWNYASVHAYGLPKMIDFGINEDLLEKQLMQLVHQHEPSYQLRWDSLTEKYKQGMMRGIIGFEMKVTKLEGAFKLSQNKTIDEQQKIARALLASSRSAETETGKLMLERLELSKSS